MQKKTSAWEIKVKYLTFNKSYPQNVPSIYKKKNLFLNVEYFVNAVIESIFEKKNFTDYNTYSLKDLKM